MVKIKIKKCIKKKKLKKQKNKQQQKPHTPLKKKKTT